MSNEIETALAEQAEAFETFQQQMRAEVAQANQRAEKAEKVADAIVKHREQRITGAVHKNIGAFGFGEDELKRYSPCAAVRNMLKPGSVDAGFEREVDQELRSKLGVALPENAMLLPMARPTNTEARLLNYTGSPSGSTLVANAHAPELFIDVLRGASVGLSLGPTVIDAQDYRNGNISIPRKTASSTAYWFTGDGTDSITESTPRFDSVTLQPRFVGALMSASYRMVLQADPKADALFLRDLADTLGTAVDVAFFNGSGSANQPRGILNQSGINTVTVGSPNSITWSHVVQLEEEVAKDNGPNRRRAYAAHPTLIKHLKTRAKGGADYGAGFLIEPNGTMNQYPVGVSTNVPATTLLFGDFSEAIWTTWGVVALLIDPYTNFASGTVRLRAIMPCDFAVRHAESFAKTV